MTDVRALARQRVKAVDVAANAEERSSGRVGGKRDDGAGERE